jgi:hypothetical protein
MDPTLNQSATRVGTAGTRACGSGSSRRLRVGLIVLYIYHRRISSIGRRGNAETGKPEKSFRLTCSFISPEYRPSCPMDQAVDLPSGAVPASPAVAGSCGSWLTTIYVCGKSALPASFISDGHSIDTQMMRDDAPPSISQFDWQTRVLSSQSPVYTPRYKSPARYKDVKTI